jgi:CoA binding domain
VGVLLSVPMAYGLYALLPVPYSLALQWFLCGFIEAVLLGLVAAAVYRPKTTISSFSVGRKRRAQLSFGAEQNGCPECERLFRKEREAMVQFTAAEVHRRGFHPTNVSNVSIDADKKDLLRRERLLDEAATSLEHLRAERHIHLRTHTQSVFHKLRDSGYEVYAISPNATETESVRCYPDLASIPGNSAVLSITSASSSLLYRRLAGNISLTFMTSFPLQTHRWARLCTLRFGLSVRADPSLESTTDPPPPSRTDR